MGVLDSEAMVLRIRAWRGDLDFSDSGRDGSSRRNDLYIERNLEGVAILSSLIEKAVVRVEKRAREF